MNNKNEKLMIDEIATLLQSYPDHVVNGAFAQFGTNREQEKESWQWMIYKGTGYPPKPYEWKKIQGVIYFRDPRTKPASNEKNKPCKGCGGKRNIAKGLAGLAKAEFGFNKASEKLIAERKAICMACVMNDIGRCTKCNCYLHAKIRIKKERCPLGKW